MRTPHNKIERKADGSIPKQLQSSREEKEERRKKLF
jgi:hypothetical protein